MASFEKMIKHFYPDAIEGTDFAVETADNGERNIVSWNTDKLGTLPDDAWTKYPIICLPRIRKSLEKPYDIDLETVEKFMSILSQEES